MFLYVLYYTILYSLFTICVHMCTQLYTHIYMNTQDLSISRHSLETKWFAQRSVQPFAH